MVVPLSLPPWNGREQVWKGITHYRSPSKNNTPGTGTMPPRHCHSMPAMCMQKSKSHQALESYQSNQQQQQMNVNATGRRGSRRGFQCLSECPWMECSTASRPQWLKLFLSPFHGIFQKQERETINKEYRVEHIDIAIFTDIRKENTTLLDYT